MPFVLKQNLNRSIDEQVSLFDIQLSSECNHLLEKMIAIGVNKMIQGELIDKPAKRIVAEQNFARFMEMMLNQSKELGCYPVVDERVFDVAMLEIGSIWPFRTGG